MERVPLGVSRYRGTRLWLSQESSTFRDATEISVLVQHLGLQAATLALVAFVLARTLALDARPALIVALALVTPFIGFILDSLGEEHLVCEEHAESCWQRNRRDEFEITTGALVTAR